MAAAAAIFSHASAIFFADPTVPCTFRPPNTARTRTFGGPRSYHLMQSNTNAKVYDAIIVGSGAGGGMSAKILSDAGLNIAIVEAGPYFDPADPKTRTQLKWEFESPRRGASTRFRPFGDFDMAYGGWDIEGQPYTAAEGTEFHWFRSQMLGGRTNHWGADLTQVWATRFQEKGLRRARRQLAHRLRGREAVLR